MLVNGCNIYHKRRWLATEGRELHHFGQCKKINVSKQLTTIVGGKGDQHAVENQIDKLKVEITQTDNLKECERIKKGSHVLLVVSLSSVLEPPQRSK